MVGSSSAPLTEVNQATIAETVDYCAQVMKSLGHVVIALTPWIGETTGDIIRP